MVSLFAKLVTTYQPELFIKEEKKQFVTFGLHFYIYNRMAFWCLQTNSLHGLEMKNLLC